MNHVIKLKFYRMFNINIWKILGLLTWCLQEQEAEKAQINPVRANQKPQFDTIWDGRGYTASFFTYKSLSSWLIFALFEGIRDCREIYLIHLGILVQSKSGATERPFSSWVAYGRVFTGILTSFSRSSSWLVHQLDGSSSGTYSVSYTPMDYVTGALYQWVY